MKLLLSALAFSAVAHGQDGEKAKPKESPARKVINLLKDMQLQIETETAQDKAVYDKMVCWCGTNRKEKEASIADAEAAIPELKATIEELNAKFGQLFQEIKEHKASIKEGQESLSNATAQREKEAAAFQQMSNEQTTAVSQMRAAINVLEKLHGESLLQTSDAASKIKDVLNMLSRKYSDIISREDISTTFSLLQSSEPYAAQSGEIFGFLKSMLDSMSANFAEAEAAEKQAAKSFATMKQAKEQQIAAEKKMLADKEESSTEARLTMQKTKKQLKQTEEQLEEDSAFLAELVAQCKENDKEWAARAKDRAVEVKALNETIAILNSDSMRDLTFTQTMMQRTAVVKAQIQMDRVSAILKKTGAKAGNMDMVMLGATAGLDGMDKVVAKIDKMIGDIKRQKQEERTGSFGYDWCNEEFDSNGVKTNEANYLRDDLVAKQAEAEQTIKALIAKLKQLQAEIVEMQVELQRAANERQEAHKDNAQTYKEQEAVVKLLGKAQEKLQEVYGGSFLQAREPEKKVELNAPGGLSKGGYKKNAGGGGVISMITEITQDAMKVQVDAMNAEVEQVKTYGEFVQSSFAGIGERQRAVVSNTEDKAEREKELEATKKEIRATLKNLESLHQNLADLHTKCDFLLKNFDVRQQAMDEEITSLQQAKQILSGMQA